MSNSSSEDTMIAAYLTRRLGRLELRTRKEPLAFVRRGRWAESLGALPPEPEDARLTGATRSLYRRLLALNLPPTLRMQVSSTLTLAQKDAKIA